MHKIKALITSIYIFGVIGNTIYLHFFHSIWKYKSLPYNIGQSLVWFISSKYNTPILLWILIIALSLFVTFADEIATAIDKQDDLSNDK